MKIPKKKKLGGGGGGSVGVAQGGCERKIEVFVKIQKKKYIFLGWVGRGGGGGGSGGGGVRVYVNQELKFFGKFKKKNGGGGPGAGGGRVGGSGWM